MTFILGSVGVIVLLTIASGLYLLYNNTDSSKRKLKKALGINLFAFVPVLLMAIVLFVPSFSGAAEEAGAAGSAGLGLLGAALSTGLACVGAGIATGSVGAAALGAVSEDPAILGKTLIFVGLAEGIAIYGIIISILILGRL